VIGLAGATALSAAAHLGGHLSFTRGVGPNETVYDAGGEDWTPAADASVLAEGRPTRVVVGDTPVLVLKQGERIYAIHDRCSHRGCSLSDGEVEGASIRCACHGSTFALADGAVERGPATAPQPAFQTRVAEGRVEVRRLS
jgi:nitrite reductase/ring-hydroxylating ferredoxin subunit